MPAVTLALWPGAITAVFSSGQFDESIWCEIESAFLNVMRVPISTLAEAGSGPPRCRTMVSSGLGPSAPLPPSPA